METAHQGPDAKERSESQLCLNCMVPNSPLANFCYDCGAPLSSFAATGPMESIMAEGHLYRKAVETPRSWIVIAGVWMIFGMMLFSGALPLFIETERRLPGVLLHSAILIPFAVAVLWKTTRSFFAFRRAKLSNH